MPRIGKTLLAWVAVGGVLVSGASSAVAVAPSESLLPDTTVGYLSVPDVEKLVDQWNKTQIGQLLQDPVMEPFVKDVQRQLNERWSSLTDRLGLTIDDIRGLAHGELAVAVIQPNHQKDQEATALLVDVSGNTERAQAVLEKVSETLTRRGGKKSQSTAAGVQVTSFEMPKPEPDAAAPKVSICLAGDLLAAADNLAVLQGILQRVAGQKGSVLGDLPSYQAIMKRAAQDAGEATPHLRWFLEPFGYAETMRLSIPERDRHKGKTMLQVLQEQGFTAIQGLGGHVELAVDGYQFVHRTLIFAPKPFEKSMQMLRFPNETEFAPAPWVPRDLATYTTFYLDILNAFDNVGPMFDALFGGGEQGVFRDVVEGIKSDPNGPQVDLREDLAAQLGQRVTVLRSYEVPITTTSERLLFAIEATNPQSVATAIEKNLATDRTFRKREFGKAVIWESIPPKKTAVPTIQLEFPGLGNEEEKPARAAESERPDLLPNAAITVAHGHLLVASHYDFLVQILKQADEGGAGLGEAVEYQQVQEALTKLGAGSNTLRAFSRTDEQVQPTYELIRQGKMPESETMLGRMLNTMFGSGKKGTVRKQEIDGSKMPDYEVVRRYLGPSGAFLTSEDDGWFFKGVLLTK